MTTPFEQKYNGADVTSIIRSSSFAKAFSDVYKDLPILVGTNQESIDKSFKLIDKKFSLAILARDTYFISEVNKAIKENYQQFVFVGSGFDLKWLKHMKDSEKKSHTFFEADLPFIIRKKQKALKDSNIYIPDNLRFVTIDLEKDSLIERLLTAGFDTKKQTVFLFEGVIYFLTDKILNKINNLDFFKTKSDIAIFMDFWDDEMVKNRSRRSRQFYSFPFGKNNNEIIASFKEMGFQNIQIESILKYFPSSAAEIFHQIPSGWQLLSANYKARSYSI